MYFGGAWCGHYVCTLLKPSLHASTSVPRGWPLTHGPLRILKMKAVKQNSAISAKLKLVFREYSEFALDFEAYANAFLVFENLPI